MEYNFKGIPLGRQGRLPSEFGLHLYDIIRVNSLLITPEILHSANSKGYTTGMPVVLNLETG
jgi:hypothetical protein